MCGIFETDPCWSLPWVVPEEEDGLLRVVEVGGGHEPPLPREHPVADLQEQHRQVHARPDKYNVVMRTAGV